MQPLYSVGTRASLISTRSTHKNEQHARTFRNMFSHHTDSDEDAQINRTPSLSSSSSSHKTPLSHSTIVEENHSEPTLTNTSTPTLSFLARNHTLGRHHHRKPKTTKSNSSFVQKIITNDQLNKILATRTSQDTNLFYNCGTSFLWVDASGHPKVNGKILEIFFSLCWLGTSFTYYICKSVSNIT